MKHALAGLAALLCAGAGAASAPALRDLIWTDPATDVAHALTHAPRECLSARTNDVELGRALFRSRTLLGGPAARVGLSCDSCHSTGRTNAHFLLPELTDRAGHADVTSAWSSRVRDDGVANPRPIPDLAGAATRASFGAQREPSLDTFMRSVIVDEFQGALPSDATMAALHAYIAALEPCEGATPLTLTDIITDARRAAIAAERASTSDPTTARLAHLAAQDALARLTERLPERRFQRERRELESLARDLAPTPTWRARFEALATRLTRRERATYANEQTLRRALQR